MLVLWGTRGGKKLNKRGEDNRACLAVCGKRRAGQRKKEKKKTGERQGEDYESRKGTRKQEGVDGVTRGKTEAGNREDSQWEGCSVRRGVGEGPEISGAR